MHQNLITAMLRKARDAFTQRITTYTVIRLIVLVVILLAPFFAAELSRECRHADQNYAYHYATDILQLGQGRGLLVVTGPSVSCLRVVSRGQSMVHDSERKIEDSLTCKRLQDFFIQNEKFILENDRRPRKIRVMAVIGRTLYYGHEGDDYAHNIQLPDDFPPMNEEFDHPQIGKWMSENIASYRMKALTMVRESENVPSLPRILGVYSDNQAYRVLTYSEVDPDSLTDTKRFKVGKCNEKIESIYLDSREASNRNIIRPVVFFDQYYGHVTIDLAKKSADTFLQPFPILPMQSVFGCPINLCWWPQTNDIMYADGAYYFFQSNWLFRSIAGDPSPNGILDVENVYRLDSYGINFTVQAAYFDYGRKKMMFVRHLYKMAKYESYAVRIEITNDQKQISRITETNDDVIRIGLPQSGTSILAAFMTDSDSDSGMLWVAVRRAEKTWIMGLREQVHLRQYTMEREENMPFREMQAMFYNHDNGYLYAISGFFVYVYENAKNRFSTTADGGGSRCVVTYAAAYFNCSGNYYLNMKKFTDMKQYFSLARRNHKSGPLLPGRCVWRENLPPEPIVFADKNDDENDQDENGKKSGDDTNNGSGFSGRIAALLKIEYLLMAAALIGGITVTVLSFYCFSNISSAFRNGCWCRGRRSGGGRGGSGGLRRGDSRIRGGRRSGGRSAEERLKQEKKLKQYLKRRYKSFMNPSISPPNAATGKNVKKGGSNNRANLATSANTNTAMKNDVNRKKRTPKNYYHQNNIGPSGSTSDGYSSSSNSGGSGGSGKVNIRKA